MRGRYFSQFLCALLVWLISANGSFANDISRVAEQDTAAAQPNFVVIFTDDQGYQDLGCFGAPRIKTPNLDRMATEGRKFTSFYSACSVCSPSRAALLTGCYPPRVGVTKVLFPRDSVGLNPDEITIAETLQDRGYATACIGKWHLGHKPKFLPTRQGFDYYFGIPYSNDMQVDPDARFADDVILREGVTLDEIVSKSQKDQPKNKVPLMRNEEIIEYPCEQSTLTRRYTEEAIEFIKQNREQPFFLYLPHTMPHIPIFASEDFAGKSAGGLYGDTIEEIDWSVGEILKSIQEFGLDENTLVIFTTDNGPWNLKNGHGGSALPLRGFKFQTYEGGMRVPCIMRWPGTVPADSTTDQVASTIDLAPTLAKLSGAELPSDRVIDGKDLFSLMTFDEAESPHDAFFYYKNDRLSAVRQGAWKVRISPANPGKSIERLVELYDLDKDISESNNLAEQLPSKVMEIFSVGQAFDEKLRMNKRPIGTIDE